MANLLLVADPDDDRRRRFLNRAVPRLRIAEHLATASIAAGYTEAAWATASTAPLSSTLVDGGGAVVLGQMLPPGGNTELTAAVLQRWWDLATPEEQPACDGYHLAISWDADGAVVVGCDPLGHLPVYWWSEQGVLLAGSSPELFRHHALFRGRPSPVGIAGLLLTNGLVGGQTVLE